MQLIEPYFLFHDFQTSTYQMDTIFLCSIFLLILEIKNITGSIAIDDTTYQFKRRSK
ncbi:nuclease-related domain-containing protein [Bacillus ndiopicus]|uniref:nuclease-related domain-containing protein n=1 Tax=Bacillus ndiopicus TaxID=1347368 RepID=UPI0009DFA4C3